MLKTEDVRAMIIEDLARIKEMPVEEYTLYRKWDEYANVQWTKAQLNDMWKMKQMIWQPDDINKYQDVEPVVIPIEGNRIKYWDLFRKGISSAPWHQNPGRFARFFIQDKKTGKYLGVISLASDFLAMYGRDKYITWTEEDRIKYGMLQHTAVGSSIVPTQPFGYNYTGGKLTALLIASDVVEDYWNSKYPEKLVGITTTSLYGGLSQYSNLKYWRKCEPSSGKNPIELSTKVYKVAREWLKQHHPDIAKHVDSVTHSKPKTLGKVISLMKIKTFSSKFMRGVYFCPLYDNFQNFLSRKDTNVGNKMFDNSVEALTEIWREKYAKKRFNKLKSENRLNPDSLYYSDVANMTWEETKEKYLADVGR
jgi:hypothetical protein